MAIDTTLTPALIEEGFMRELISKVQTMRKEADFQVTDRIRIAIACGETLTKVVAARGAEVAAATLADALTVSEPLGYVKEWDINGEAATIGVEKV